MWPGRREGSFTVTRSRRRVSPAHEAHDIIRCRYANQSVARGGTRDGDVTRPRGPILCPGVLVFEQNEIYVKTVQIFSVI